VSFLSAFAGALGEEHALRHCHRSERVPSLFAQAELHAHGASCNRGPVGGGRSLETGVETTIAFFRRRGLSGTCLPRPGTSARAGRSAKQNVPAPNLVFRARGNNSRTDGRRSDERIANSLSEAMAANRLRGTRRRNRASARPISPAILT